MTNNEKVQELLKLLAARFPTTYEVAWALDRSREILAEQAAVEALPKAVDCILASYHRPKVTRFVNHHIQPQAAGGLTEPDNIAQLCDNCHMTVHVVMWVLRTVCAGMMASTADLGSVPIGTRKQKELGRIGYNKCVLAGTWTRIPKEA